jgi:Tol biopolymer transport system component
MDELEARPIPGAADDRGIGNPVFSPDGRSLVFSADSDGTLKRIPVTGGTAMTVCQTDGAPFGVSWGADGIVYARGQEIMRVSPNGGLPERLIHSENGVAGPQVLPGGQAVLFSVRNGGGWDAGQIVVQALNSGGRKTLIESGTRARYLSAGYLVYAVEGTLFAVPFDARRLEVTGKSVMILEGVARNTGTGTAHFGVSDTGSLIYIPGPISTASSQLGLLDRHGDMEPLKLPPGPYFNPRVSRDGKRVVYGSRNDKNASIWVYDLSGLSSPRKLTLPGTGANRYPVWSSDGERVAFQSDREGDSGIFWQRADGSGNAERLTKPEKGVSHVPDSWSPDGKTLSFTEEKGASSALWTYSFVDKKATLFAADPSSRLDASMFSPGGDWIVYRSGDASLIGSQLFIAPFPPTGTRYQVPHEGNDHGPLWLPDGKSIAYFPGPGRLSVISVTNQPSPSFGRPVPVPIGRLRALSRDYDVFPDGKRFIGVFGLESAALPEIQVILGWFEVLKQRVPVH